MFKKSNIVTVRIVISRKHDHERFKCWERKKLLFETQWSIKIANYTKKNFSFLLLLMCMGASNMHVWEERERTTPPSLWYFYVWQVLKCWADKCSFSPTTHEQCLKKEQSFVSECISAQKNEIHLPFPLSLIQMTFKVCQSFFSDRDRERDARMLFQWKIKTTAKMKWASLTSESVGKKTSLNDMSKKVAWCFNQKMF